MKLAGCLGAHARLSPAAAARRPNLSLSLFRSSLEAVAAAEEAALAAGTWPPRNPAPLAAGAAALLRLAAQWHSVRGVLLPEPEAGAEAGAGQAAQSPPSRVRGRLWEQKMELAAGFPLRLLTTAQELTGAAAAAAAAQPPAQLQPSLQPLLDAPAVACKLLLLAASDAVHWTLLGVHGAGAPEAGQPQAAGGGTPASPCQPWALVLPTAGAAADCAQRLLGGDCAEADRPLVHWQAGSLAGACFGPPIMCAEYLCRVPHPSDCALTHCAGA